MDQAKENYREFVRRPGGRRARRGSIYLITVGTAMIVTVLALAALTNVRIQRRELQGVSHAMEAELIAAAAIEMALFRIENDPDWRQKMKDGVWEVDQSAYGGTYSFQGIDPVDGDLTDSDEDSVVIIGTGKCGPARQKVQVRLEAKLDPLTCLEVSMHANNIVSLFQSTITGDQTISANNNVIATTANVGPDVEAVNAITGGTYTGSQTTGITPRTVPDPVTVFDEYKASGTWISIPIVSGVRTIAEEYVGPDDPPGSSAATDPNGVYVIDCEGNDVQIRNSRIVGTLVLLNAGSGSCIYYSVNWEPAVSNYPALLVQGRMDLVYTNINLSESDFSKDFNGDTDTIDTYPSLIKGLVYISGDSGTETDSIPVSYTEQITVGIEGVFVVGNSYSQSSNGAAMNLIYRSTYFDDPPPGFHDPPRMVISPGTWEKVVD